jgi:catechol 2,3-dioxygenase-like lactoylglutathione lyase family enzyme
MPELAGVHHVALTVRDRDASKAWYADVLGFNPLIDMEVSGTMVALLAHPGTGLVLGVRRHADGAHDSFDEFQTGLDHLSFRVSGRSELESWATHFDAKGVTQSPIAETPYGCVLVFRDPDNIQLELISDPGS